MSRKSKNLKSLLLESRARVDAKKDFESETAESHPQRATVSTVTGKPRAPMSEATKEKIRAAMQRADVKAKIAAKMQGNRFAVGYQWTEEQKAKLSKSLLKYHQRVRAAMEKAETVIA